MAAFASRDAERLFFETPHGSRPQTGAMPRVRMLNGAYAAIADKAGVFAAAAEREKHDHRIATGTTRDRRIRRSRVTSGTVCTTLVAAISSSAGSPWKSSRVEVRATSRSIGHT